jgi:hypothetical protein
MIKSLRLSRFFFAAVIALFKVLSSEAQSYLWANALGGTEGETANSIATDKDNNVYVCGSFSGSPDFDPSSGTAVLTGKGSLDIFLAKYDKDGKYLWAISIGGSELDAAYHLAIGPDNNVCMTGVFRGTVDFDPSAGEKSFSSAGETDIFLCKFSSSGQFMWANYFSGAKFDDGQNIGTDSLGNIYLTGHFASSCTFDKTGVDDPLFSEGASDIFFAKFDKDGKYIWARNVGGPTFDFGQRISVNPDGSFYLGGNFSGTVDFNPFSGTNALISDGQSNIFLALYDKNGNYKWAKKIGGFSSESLAGLTSDASGKVYMCGTFSNIGDFDPSDDSANLKSAGQSDIFIAAYNKNGAYLWAKSMGGVNDDNGTGIAVYNDRLYISGYFRGTIDVDPGAGTNILTALGEVDMFFCTYDTAGNYIRTKQLGGTDYDFAETITTDVEGNICLSGYFRGTADFDPSSSTKLLTVAGQADVFLSKYSPVDNNTSIHTPQSSASFICYPNPSTGSFYIQRMAGDQAPIASIYNSLGLLLYEIALDQMETVISLNGQPAGLYIMRISDGQNLQATQTLVKQ